MRDFFKYTLASFTGSILFFILFSVFAVIGAFGLIGALIASVGETSAAPEVEDKTILVYDLATIINDAEYIPTPSEALLGGGLIDQLTLREAINGIEAAADDDRIVGLYLTGGVGVGVGPGALVELRRAIETFRESGKPILAYAVSWDEGEYYLASTAETIAMNPFGGIEMNGLYSEVMYPLAAFEKVGIGFQVTRVGRYKSAVEPLLQPTMSAAEREQTQQLLGDIWGNILTTAATHRDLTPPQLQAIADGAGLLFGQAAIDQGLVDRLAYTDEIVTELRTLTAEDEDAGAEDAEEAASFRQIDLALYAEQVEDPYTVTSSDNEIALVYAEGTIIDGPGNDATQVIAGDTLSQTIREIRQDEDVKAIVLRVNSPGGSAIASEAILRELQLAQEDGYPIVVSMGNVAASGGYWIASTADLIFAEPTTITGSIGVFGFYANLADLSEQVGINWETIKTAQTADIFTPIRPKSAAELATLQTAVDQIYEAFLDRVATGRELSRDRVAELAQGRVWSGTAALELGLVDELGGLDAALQAAADLAAVDDWTLRPYPQADPWDRFWAQFGEVEARPAIDPLTAQLLAFKDEILLLRTFNDPQDVYARMPFMIRVK